jgi:hypothetical protein
MPAIAAPAAVEVSLPLGEADLRRIEAALLDALLDVHSDRGNAVDRLLDDPGFAGREQVEQLLVAAVLDTHPDRNRALDRLLDDMTRSAPAV